MKLTIIIPVYNEVNTISILVKRVMDVDYHKEIIIVDDASTDGTKDALKGIKQTEVKVVYHKTNRGKGAAIQTAINEISGDIVIIQDADLEYDPADYPNLLQPILDGKADVVYGSRFWAVPTGFYCSGITSAIPY